MKFSYRYVGFGATFDQAEGYRTVEESKVEPCSLLFENELAVDVGGVCLGYNNEQASIFDHHFTRKDRGQFPSATAAVLHKAGEIYRRFADIEESEKIWLVTHNQPDFDAFASMYLVRKILEGKLPHDGWEEIGLNPDGYFSTGKEINWFEIEKTISKSFDKSKRWPLLIAANSAYVDNCRTFRCPRNRTLHAILYAAGLRGRNLQEDGAWLFFEEVRKHLSDCENLLNPLTDSVLEESAAFAPELKLLDEQPAAYDADLTRARKVVLNVRKSKAPFDEWYNKVKLKPLFVGSRSEFIPITDVFREDEDTFSQVDGIFLRDPQCFLFKEWARTDRRNSSMNQGFLFTGIAYSDGRSDGVVNTTDYWFSLDPERADSRHLYDIWIALQQSEAQAIHGLPDAKRGTPRHGFEERAGTIDGKFYKYFSDPWFDGSNYDCTLVATPNNGTHIGPPGRKDDLSDDPVVEIVQALLETSYFEGEVECVDIPISYQANRASIVHRMSFFSHPESLKEVKPFHYRFCSIQLRDDVEVFRGDIAEQIGKSMWKLLDVDPHNGVPIDFVQAHLSYDQNSIGIWNRDGLVVAYKARVSYVSERTKSFLEKIAAMSGEFKRIYAEAQTKPNSQSVLQDGERLLRQVIQLKQEISEPEFLSLRRFFKARGLDDATAMLSNLNNRFYGKFSG